MRNKYPSDITRDQFGIVKPFLESATKATRPYTYDLYDIFCAILYVLREGCRWRALPHDFPKWEVVCCHYRKWGKKNYTGHDERSAFEKALEELAMPERIINGRSPGPSMLAIDSKSIKNAFTAGEKGYDAGKKISGAKVRLAVDILGLPHGIHATTADFTDRDGAIELAAINAGKFESVETVLADSAYSGESFAHTIKGLVDAKVEVARRNEARMFIVLPKRWIVERSFGWADNCRRLWKGLRKALGHILPNVCNFIHFSSFEEKLNILLASTGTTLMVLPNNTTFSCSPRSHFGIACLDTAGCPACSYSGIILETAIAKNLLELHIMQFCYRSPQTHLLGGYMPVHRANSPCFQIHF